MAHGAGRVGAARLRQEQAHAALDAAHRHERVAEVDEPARVLFTARLVSARRVVVERVELGLGGTQVLFRALGLPQCARVRGGELEVADRPLVRRCTFLDAERERRDQAVALARLGVDLGESMDRLVVARHGGQQANPRASLARAVAAFTPQLRDATQVGRSIAGRRGEL